MGRAQQRQRRSITTMCADLRETRMKIYAAISETYGARDAVILRLMQRLDGEILNWSDPLPDDADIFISWRLKLCPNFEEARDKGVCIVCIDLGYFDDTKFECFSVSVGGVHGHANDVKGIYSLPERPHPPVLPWRHDGHRIQIISTGFTRRQILRGIKEPKYPVDWLETTREAAEEAFGMESYIRYHPRKLPEGEAIPPPLEATFEETFCSVTYSSTTAIQTILAGVPTVIMHERSPAYCMGSPELEAVRPDGREDWIHALSYRNYEMLNDDDLDKAAEYILMAYEETK